MLLYWAGLQVLSGVGSIGDASAGVAFWAHVGGFATGLLLAKPFSSADHVAAHGARRWRPERLLRERTSR